MYQIAVLLFMIMLWLNLEPYPLPEYKHGFLHPLVRTTRAVVLTVASWYMPLVAAQEASKSRTLASLVQQVVIQ